MCEIDPFVRSCHPKVNMMPVQCVCMHVHTCAYTQIGACSIKIKLHV